MDHEADWWPPAGRMLNGSFNMVCTLLGSVSGSGLGLGLGLGQLSAGVYLAAWRAVRVRFRARARVGLGLRASGVHLAAWRAIAQRLRGGEMQRDGRVAVVQLKHSAPHTRERLVLLYREVRLLSVA